MKYYSLFLQSEYITIRKLLLPLLTVKLKIPKLDEKMNKPGAESIDHDDLQRNWVSNNEMHNLNWIEAQLNRNALFSTSKLNSKSTD